MHDITSCQRLEENAELAEYETDYGVHSICKNHHYLTTQKSRLSKVPYTSTKASKFGQKQEVIPTKSNVLIFPFFWLIADTKRRLAVKTAVL
jgi:hypothetical protein